MQAPNPRCRLCMLQAHVFGSSKCLQKRRVGSVYMLTHRHTHTHTLTRTHAHTYTHTHTHTHTRATECPLSPVPRRYSTPGTQQQAYTTETLFWQYADQTAHASSHRKTVMPLRRKIFCAQFLDVIHSSHRGQSNPFWKKAQLVLSSQHKSESIHTFYSHGGRFVIPVDRTCGHC